MNSLIERIFKDFEVDGKAIPVSLIQYNGKADTYIVYSQVDAEDALDGDDELIGYIDYYDIDIYSKRNYLKVIESVKQKMKENGFRWQLDKSSGDMYNTDTKFYHKTLNFAIPRMEV